MIPYKYVEETTRDVSSVVDHAFALLVLMSVRSEKSVHCIMKCRVALEERHVVLWVPSVLCD